MNKKIKILVADDHQILREGIIMMLKNQNKIKFEFTEASNGQEVLEIVKSNPVDIILLDLSMPIIDGIETLKKLQNSSTRIPVIMLSMHNNESLIRNSYKFGAKGFLFKTCSLSELLDAITTVLQNKKYFNQEVSNILFEEINTKSRTQKIYLKNEILSKREVQIITLLMKAYTNIDISDELNISIRTVEGHRLNIMRKLNLKNLSEVLLYGFENEFYN